MLDCPPNLNGNTPQEAESIKQHTHGGTNSCPMGSTCATYGKATFQKKTASQMDITALRQWEATNRTHMESLMSQEMCGNGATTGFRPHFTETHAESHDKIRKVQNAETLKSYAADHTYATNLTATDTE